MSELIQYQRDDGIVTLTLNSPETRNPISDDDMIEALLAALERLETDPEARVAILTGAGSAFSSGGNVKKMGAAGGLACMCDLRIAGESAWFAESFVKLGIIPGDGGAWTRCWKCPPPCRRWQGRIDRQDPRDL